MGLLFLGHQSRGERGRPKKTEEEEEEEEGPIRA